MEPWIKKPDISRRWALPVRLRIVASADAVVIRESRSTRALRGRARS